MNRRKFIKLSGVAALVVTMPVTIEASILDNLKEKYEKYKKTLLARKYEITFAEMYPKAFWKKSYFSWIILATTTVAAGAITYFTAGAGAPEAAAGVSTVASWIGGGGAGSYMAGLSAVGSAVGGNAMVGAAILNGISLGTVGWSAGKISLTIASKVALAIDVSMNGFVLINNLQSGKSAYVFEVKIPKGIGSDKVEDLVDKIYDLYNEKSNAIENKDYLKAKTLDKNLKNYYMLGVKILQEELTKENPNIYDVVVLSLIAYKVSEMELYYNALNLIENNKNKVEKRSFLDYLWGIYYLSTSEDTQKAFNYFQNSYFEENYVIEPVLIIIDILGQNYNKNKILITTWVDKAVENYDGDKYDGRNLLNLYYKAATVSFVNKDYQQALVYFEKAYDELGILGKILPFTKPIKKIINLNIAICYKHLRNQQQAQDYLKDALDYCKTDKEKEEIKKVYYES